MCPVTSPPSAGHLQDQSLPGTPVWPGNHEPRGATWSCEGTNFAVFSPDATGVEVCLFTEDDEETRHRLTERTLGTWHGTLPGVAPGQRYGFRVDGPWAPARGLYFNPAKLLLDPYARAVTGTVSYEDATYGYVRPQRYAERDPRDSAPSVVKSVVVCDDFDWGGDRHPRVSWTDTVVYECHVRGFTRRCPELAPGLRGTYAGLGSPPAIEYLTGLGVTAVELLPVHQFLTEPLLAARGQTNYWGYNTLGWFAPHGAYSSTGDTGGQVREFKEMVKALHAAGIEVLLDVVYNHSAEGPVTGPTLSLRGLDDRGFYKRAGGDPTAYLDLTGCGNTVDAGYPPALRLILDSLRYWVTEMHVDGFRFDLASALARTGASVDLHGSFLSAIGQDPVLRDVKLIAEPWDVTGEGYLVGRYPAPFVEWNDRYRNTVRDFWLSPSGGVRDVATRLSGSSDLYADDGRAPYASVNLLTAHDGFTLRDLVSYDRKHNEANGEQNRDGSNDNRSWNCGVEGETTDAAVVALRQRLAANLLVTLCLSTGVPMLTMGDERGRTQSGNNNAYAQDNEVSWLDWSSEWDGLLELTRTALRLRREHPALRQRHFFIGRPSAEGGPPDLAWIHPGGTQMTHTGWHDTRLQTIGMFVSGDPLRAVGPRGEALRDASFLLWLNAHPGPVEVRMPEYPRIEVAHVVLSTDTSWRAGTVVQGGATLGLEGRSLVVLRST
jgi:glycogen operon protein